MGRGGGFDGPVHGTVDVGGDSESEADAESEIRLYGGGRQVGKKQNSPKSIILYH
jgi:hypothetical protein